MEREITKFMRNKYRQYKVSDMYSLYDKYQRPSIAKHHAWDCCEDLCKEYNGHGLRLVGGNMMQFSAGFIGEIENPETGELEKSYIHITKEHTRYIPLSEI